MRTWMSSCPTSACSHIPVARPLIEESRTTTRGFAGGVVGFSMCWFIAGLWVGVQLLGELLDLLHGLSDNLIELHTCRRHRRQVLLHHALVFVLHGGQIVCMCCMACMLSALTAIVFYHLSLLSTSTPPAPAVLASCVGIVAADHSTEAEADAPTQMSGVHASSPPP